MTLKSGDKLTTFGIHDSYGTVGAIIDGYILTAGHVARRWRNGLYKLGIVENPMRDYGLIPHHGGDTNMEFGRPVLGHVVYKDGAATGRTYGVITDRMEDGLLVVRPLNLSGADHEISAPGDSGAVWRDLYTHKGVALHIGGETVPGLRYEAAYAIPFPLDLQSLTEGKITMPMDHRVQPMSDGSTVREDTAVAEGQGSITVQVVTFTGKPSDIMPSVMHLIGREWGGGGR